MRKTLVLALLLLSSPAGSFAQDTPAFDVSGGYSFLRLQDIEANFHGWLASVGANLNEWLAIVGEVGGNYKTFEGGDVSAGVFSFMVGPRFAVRANPSFTPFGQFLAGARRRSVSRIGESASITLFAMQPGAGVDFWVRPNVGIRFAGDYRRIFSEDEGNEFRFHAGVVLIGGSR